MRGAEAIVKRTTFIGRKAIIKERIKKRYRNEELDRKLRKERTKNEARLLHKAKLAGVPAPTVLSVDEYTIVMEYIDGRKPEIEEVVEEAAKMLEKLHRAHIIHGDYTPANMIKNKKVWIIDFGLGAISHDLEDKAVDVFTFLRCGADEERFWKHYNYDKERVKKRVKEIEKRVRYSF